MCRVITEAGEIVKSCSIVVTGKVSILNLFLITSVLFINLFTLVCYGFKLLKHI